MQANKLSEYFQIAIRLVPSGLKLIFLLYLGKFHGGIVLGEYALIASGMAIFVVVLGFEINAEASRLVHNCQEGAQGQIVFALLVSIFAFNLVLLPLFYTLVTSFKLFNNALFFLIALAFISEHVCTEVFRIMIMFSKRKAATYFHFLRISPALLFPIFFEYSGVLTLDINIILISIAFFNILSLSYIYTKLPTYLHILKSDKSFVNLSRLSIPIIKKLLWGSRYYYIVAIISTLGTHIDKFLINNFLDIEKAGLYFLISSVAGVYSMLISFTIGMKEAPSLLYSYSHKSYLEFISEYSAATKKLYLVSIPLSICVFFVFVVLMNFVYPLLNKYFLEFSIVLVGIVISSFATLNRTILLLTRSEGTMFFANILPSAVFLASIYIFKDSISLIGVSSVFMITSVLQWLIFLIGAQFKLGPNSLR